MNEIKCCNLCTWRDKTTKILKKSYCYKLGINIPEKELFTHVCDEFAPIENLEEKYNFRNAMEQKNCQ